MLQTIGGVPTDDCSNRKHTVVDGLLVVRADANTRIGGGHLMRCMALASEWIRRCGKVDFICHTDNDAFRELVQSRGMRFIPVERPYPDPADVGITLQHLVYSASLTTFSCHNWVVLDGYHFDLRFHEMVRQTGFRLLVIDDMAHLPFYGADALLNQNSYAQSLRYHHDEQTVLLSGPKYALLRPEFMPWRHWHREHPEVATRILVTMGAADSRNATETVVKAICALDVPGLDVRVIVGPANPNHAALKREFEGTRKKIELLKNVTDIPSLMAWADLAVSAAGSTCWELAFMGLPNLLVVLAANQRMIAETMAEKGYSHKSEYECHASSATITREVSALIRAPELRSTLSRRCRALVDGLGAERVCNYLCQRS